MKKLFIFIFLMGFLQLTDAQKLIESFDNAVGSFFLDPPVFNDNFFTNNKDRSYCYLTNDTAHVEGTGSMKIDYRMQYAENWGGYVVRTTYKPSAADSLPYMDWSGGTHLKLRYKVLSPALMTKPGVTWIELKMGEYNEAGNRDLWLHKIAIDFKDASNEWLEVDIPLEVNADNTKGFKWQMGEGDKELQLDHIKGFEVALVYGETIGGDTSSSSTGSLLWDNLTLEGKRSVPTVFFNGKSLPSSLGNPWAWGNSTIEMVAGAGRVPELNALKWVQGYNPDWGKDAGYTGWGCTISPAFDMSWSWDIDTLKFWMKSEEGVDTIRVQLEGGGGKVGALVKPISDNQWHQYFVALKDLDPQDNTTGFTNAGVGVFGIMAQNNGITGKVIYVTEIWTGNPKIDVVAPKAVTELGVATSLYANLVTWTDVPNETKETYDVYYSDQPITDVTKAKVLKAGVKEGTLVIEQLLRSAITDQNLTYYYAIVCKDDAGNFSEPAFLNTPTINAGKGVPTIAKTAPANFVADGDLADWAGVPEIRIIRSEGTGYVAASKLLDNDLDCSALAYVAVDQDYLYFAADVTDDIYSWSATKNAWSNDAIDFFIGLFDAHDTPIFSSIKKGATPHYQFRFDEKRVTINDSDSLLLLGNNYFFGQKALTSGYLIEAKIPFTDIATKRNPAYGGDLDNLFHPAEGMQIPIDFSINDNDGNVEPVDDQGREGILCYSPYNNNSSWSNPSLWLWTWIGNKMVVDPDGIEDANSVVNSFNLAQNYPNPFNPSTKISYALQSPELVTLRVFDVLGREVVTLVNQYQTAGNHSVSFNASSLASGMYFYKLEAGSFQSIKKMMLLK